MVHQRRLGVVSAVACDWGGVGLGERGVVLWDYDNSVFEAGLEWRMGVWLGGWGGVWGGAWHGGECLPASLSSGGGAAVGGPLVGAVGAMGPFWLGVGPFRVVGGLVGCIQSRELGARAFRGLCCW